MSFKIAIASGKGGTGKTTVSVNLYHAITKYLKGNIQLVDCDVEEPNDLIFFPEAIKTDEKEVFQRIPYIDTNKCTFCRKCSEWCEFNAIAVIPSAKFAEVNGSLCHSCGACIAACKFDAIRESEESIGKISYYNIDNKQGLVEGKLKVGSMMQTMVIKDLKLNVSNKNRLTIYDAPPGTSCPVVETISDVDYVILVSEPTPFGLHDLKLMVDLLYEIKKPFGVIINKAGLGDDKTHKYIETEGIELLGEIPFNQLYASNYAKGNLTKEIPSEISDSFSKIVAKLENLTSL